MRKKETENLAGGGSCGLWQSDAGLAEGMAALVADGTIDAVFINPDQDAANNFVGKDKYTSPELEAAI